MKLNLDCGQPQVKTFWFYCLYQIAIFITPKTHQVPPRDMYIALLNLYSFFFLLPLHTSGLLFQQSQSRILMPFQFVIFSYCIVFFLLSFSFKTLANFCIFACRSTPNTSSTLRIHQLYFISDFCLSFQVSQFTISIAFFYRNPWCSVL